MKCHLSPKYGRRAVPWVIVQEGSATGELIFHVRQPATASTGVNIISPAHSECDPVARRHHDAGGPDFDVELIHMARTERLLLIMSMVRTVWSADLGVDLSV